MRILLVGCKHEDELVPLNLASKMVQAVNLVSSTFVWLQEK